MIQACAYTNPLSPERISFEVRHGWTYRDIVESLNCGTNAIVINDEIIEPSRWDSSPKDESIVIIRFVPSGEVGTFLGKVAGTAALAGLAGMAWIFTGDYDSSFMTAIWGDSTTTGDTTITTLPSIKGSSNSSDPWGAIPLILGKHYISLLYAGNPYTEIGGDDGADQYIHLAYVIGYGPLSISKIRIGENLLASNSADVRTGAITIDGLYASEGIQMEIRQDGNAMTHYPKKVKEDQLDQEILCPSGTPTYLYRTTSPGATKIEVDFTFSSGLVKFDSRGNASNASVNLKADYRVSGSSGAWINFYDTTLSKSVKKTARYSASVTVSAGQYDVRVYRVTADSTDDSTYDVATWTALRSTLADPPIGADYAASMVRLSLKIKASSVVSGSISKISCIAQSIIPVYSGSGSGPAQWTTEAATANPAAQALYLLRGAPNAKPAANSLIDWPAFEELYTWAEASVSKYPSGTEKRNLCNAVVDSQGTLRDTIGKVLACGRASLAMKGPFFSIVHDVAKSTPMALITPRNSANFNGMKSFADIPHGYRITFINADAGYQSDECIVLADGYLYDLYDDGVLRDSFGVAHSLTDIYSGAKTYKLATELESIKRWGITSYSEAWREGRYQLAKLILRPETYSVKQDFQNIIYTRGDRVKLGHDVPLIGVFGGRVKSVTVDGSSNVTSLVLDDYVTMEAGKTYGLRYQRNASGDTFFATVTTVAGTTKSLSFSPIIAAANAPAPDDNAWFGESGSDTIDAIVVGIEPSDDTSATIYLKDYSPEIFNADTGTIPNFNSHVTLPVSVDLSTVGVDTSEATQAAAGSASVVQSAILGATKTIYLYRRASSQPSTPAGNNPTGWYAQDPGGTGTLWLTKAMAYSDGTIAALYPGFIPGPTAIPAPGWSTPARVTTVATVIDSLSLVENQAKYLGMYDYAPYNPNKGDWFFYIGATGTFTQYTMYYWTGAVWSVDPDSSHVSGILLDLINNAAKAAQTITFIGNLIANTAFIETLSSKTIYSDNLTGSVSAIPQADRVKPRVEFDLHNSLLTMRDDSTESGAFRKMLLGPGEGYKAFGYDGSGSAETIIHDLADCPVVSGFSYLGHLYYLDKSTILKNFSRSTTDALTEFENQYSTELINVSSALPASIKNAKAMLFEITIWVSIWPNKLTSSSTLYYKIGYSKTYNGATDNIASAMQVSGLAPSTVNSRITSQVAIPIVYSGGVPYITISDYINFQSLSAFSALYGAGGYIQAIGFYA